MERKSKNGLGQRERWRNINTNRSAVILTAWRPTPVKNLLSNESLAPDYRSHINLQTSTCEQRDQKSDVNKGQVNKQCCSKETNVGTIISQSDLMVWTVFIVSISMSEGLYVVNVYMNVWMYIWMCECVLWMYIGVGCSQTVWKCMSNRLSCATQEFIPSLNNELRLIFKPSCRTRAINSSTYNRASIFSWIIYFRKIINI